MPKLVLGIVPARSGSLRLPNKNMKQLGGKSLVRIALEQAKESGCFAQIVLSSDSDEILGEAIEGVIPVKRPESLSGGDVPVDSVVEYLLEHMRVKGFPRYDAVVVLNPTTPLRSVGDIRAAVGKLDGSVVSSVTVTPVQYIYMKKNQGGRPGASRESGEGVWKQRDEKLRGKRAAKPSFVLNGAVFAVKTDFFEVSKRLVGPRVAMTVMPKERSVDIDDFWDYLSAKAYYEELQKRIVV